MSDAGETSGREAAALYFATRDELIQLVSGIDDAQSATMVPMSPDWSVADTVAHVCGINADVINQRFEGFGSDEWTAYQVETRRGTSVADVCAEWVTYTAPLTSHIQSDPFFGVRLTGDLIIHLQDVQHALELETDRTHAAALVGADRYVPHLQDRVLERMGVGVSVELTNGGTYPAPDGSTGEPLVLRTTAYDFLRSVSGRRSRHQVESLDWTGDPTAVLDQAWAAYGELRTEDVSA